MRVVFVFVLILVSSTVSARKIYDLTHTFDGYAPQYPLGFLGIDEDSFTSFKMTTLTEQYFGEMWQVFITNIDYLILVV